MYLTCCLIKLFTYATNTYEEQFRHIEALQTLSNVLYYRSTGGAHVQANGDGTPLPNPSNLNANLSANWQVEEEEYLQLRDDGPIDIDDSEDQADDDTEALIDKKTRKFSNVLSPKTKRPPSAFSSSAGNLNFMETIASNMNFTKAMFTRQFSDSNVAGNQIPSPSGTNANANSSLIYGSRSISNSNLVQTSNSSNSNAGVPSSSSGAVGTENVKNVPSSNRLSLDVPRIETGKRLM